MIYLTEHSNLSEGLWWAREITGEQDLGRGSWLIMCIVGNAPFLDAYVIAFPAGDGSDDPWLSGRSRRDKYTEPFRASQWEFGPRIDIPSDKDRVEYPPEPARERAFA